MILTSGRDGLGSGTWDLGFLDSGTGDSGSLDSGTGTWDSGGSRLNSSSIAMARQSEARRDEPSEDLDERSSGMVTVSVDQSMEGLVSRSHGRPRTI